MPTDRLVVEVPAEDSPLCSVVKTRELVGLHMDPPVNAAVIAVHEKLQIAAIAPSSTLRSSR